LLNKESAVVSGYETKDLNGQLSSNIGNSLGLQRTLKKLEALLLLSGKILDLKALSTITAFNSVESIIFITLHSG
jgi:hypothetical protein